LAFSNYYGIHDPDVGTQSVEMYPPELLSADESPLGLTFAASWFVGEPASPLPTVLAVPSVVRIMTVVAAEAIGVCWIPIESLTTSDAAYAVVAPIAAA
jgi:hypothetical protein